MAKSILASSGVILNSHLLCGREDPFPFPGDVEDELPRFLHGVGSFDPTSDAVIIWTRFTPMENEAGQTIPVNWEVSKDPDFRRIVASGTQPCSRENDFTVLVDVAGLPSDEKFFYRFSQVQTGALSPVGETITLPAQGDPAQCLTVAVCSCSNYPSGLFNVYHSIARSDADLVVHLGDYIYEYGEGGYGTNENTDSLNRNHDPETEILTLEDYRKRYRQYRSDENLQLAHQKKPFIVVWDDHEITDDAYRDGAGNHDADEGSYEQRKGFAIQAHSEYLPIRTDDRSRIYRNFEYGNLVNLVMLDTRILGRDRQLSLRDYLGGDGSLDVPGFTAALTDPQRSLIGPEQRAWIQTAVRGSKATWQVIGQQVLTGSIWVPAELLVHIGLVFSGSATLETYMQLVQGIDELTALKQRALQQDPTLTAAELERINTVLPYNLDAWDGYPVERERLFSLLKGRKAVVLAGDTHNAWASVLRDGSGDLIGEEFACPSVSSPGLEGFLGADPEIVAYIERAFVLLVDGLEFMDASRRGYILARFTAGAAEASYRFVDTIASDGYTELEGPHRVYIA